MEDKKELRKEMLESRDFLSAEKREEYSNKIYDNIIKSDLFNNSKTIFVFVSYKSEVDTHKLIEYSIKTNKRICVPKIISKAEGMLSIQIKGLHDLEESRYGILEPKDNTNIINPKDIELILLPGLAFDCNGGRLGYGGGFYDRYLRLTSKISIKLGMAYNMQIVKDVPIENYDYVIDGVVTEEGVCLFDKLK